MHLNLNELLKKIQKQPQDQRSVTDQLRDLRAFANRLGMYDAADFIGREVERVDRKVKGEA
jgi:hypothetical protein